MSKPTMDQFGEVLQEYERLQTEQDKVAEQLRGVKSDFRGLMSDLHNAERGYDREDAEYVMIMGGNSYSPGIIWNGMFYQLTPNGDIACAKIYDTQTSESEGG